MFPSFSEVNKNFFLSGCVRLGAGAAASWPCPPACHLPSAYQQEPCQLGWPGNALLPHRSGTTCPCQVGSRGLATYSPPYQDPCGSRGPGPVLGDERVLPALPGSDSAPEQPRKQPGPRALDSMGQRSSRSAGRPSPGGQIGWGRQGDCRAQAFPLTSDTGTWEPGGYPWRGQAGVAAMPGQPVQAGGSSVYGLGPRGASSGPEAYFRAWIFPGAHVTSDPECQVVRAHSQQPGLCSAPPLGKGHTRWHLQNLHDMTCLSGPKSNLIFLGAP